MGKKKKDKDFQKVRIKVGRKLKRQNETVVDLTTRKIKLPKERAVETETSSKSSTAIFDEAVASLDLEKHSAQFQAIQLINRILDPFVRQLLSLTTSEGLCLTVNAKQLNQLVAIFRAIFHSHSSNLSVQLGTLLSALHRLCRGVQDPRLGPCLIRLSSNLIKLVSGHPKFIDLLNALDGCAIALLQRPESTWLWVGCQLSTLVFRARSELVAVYALRSGSGHVSDAAVQLVRCSIYSRALMRLYDNLREQQSIVNVTTQRSHLLQATLAFLKDHQYTMRFALSATTRRHPFLLPRPLFYSKYSFSEPQSFHFPLDGYNLHFVFQSPSNPMGSSIDTSLLEMETPVLIRARRNIESDNSKLGGRVPAKKARKQPAIQHEPDQAPLWLNQAVQDQLLLVNLLEQGIDILGELTQDINETLLENLYCVVRGLRVFVESKPLAYLTHGNVNQGGNKSISVWGTLCRFCNKLYSQFPYRQTSSSSSELEQGLLDGSKEPHKSTAECSGDRRQPPPLLPPPPPGSTKQEIRRWQKRNMKRQNRQTRQLMNDDATVSAVQDGDQERTAPQKTKSAHSSVAHSSTMSTRTQSCTQSMHRVNQSVIELLTLLEACDFPVTVRTPSTTTCWPPPNSLLKRVAQHFFDDLFPVDSQRVAMMWPLTVTLGWLRAFDFYLLAPVRFPNRFKTVNPTRRFFSAPILTVLGRLLSGYTVFQSESNGKSTQTPLTRGQHRLYGRVIGLLTAFLTMESGRVRLTQSSETDAAEDECSNSLDYTFDYDDSWIGQALVDCGMSPELVGSPFTPLIETLRCLVRNEPPRVLYAAPVSDELHRMLADQIQQCHVKPQTAPIPVQIVDDTWAQCFVRLIQCRYTAALRIRDADQALRDKLNQAEKRADRVAELRDLRAVCGMTVPDGAEDHFGWMVAGYLPSLDGRYACPYLWQSSKDGV